jgi:ABC-type tungstate transport system substrate-binding protein
MTTIVSLISSYGAPTVVVGALVYIVLRSDIRFVYPRKKD